MLSPKIRRESFASPASEAAEAAMAISTMGEIAASGMPGLTRLRTMARATKHQAYQTRVRSSIGIA